MATASWRHTLRIHGVVVRDRDPATLGEREIEEQALIAVEAIGRTAGWWDEDDGSDAAIREEMRDGFRGARTVRELDEALDLLYTRANDARVWVDTGRDRQMDLRGEDPRDL